MDMYDRIEFQLKNVKMSRRQLAKEVGVPITTLNSAFKRKSKSLSIEMIGKISQVLDIPVNFLIGLQPFEHLEFILEHKQEIVDALPDTAKQIPNDIDDITFFKLLDSVVSEIHVTDERMTVLYKNVDLNALVDIENKSPDSRTIGERVVYDNARSEIAPITNIIEAGAQKTVKTIDEMTARIVEAIADMPDEIKKRVYDFVEFQKQQNEKEGEGGEDEK